MVRKGYAPEQITTKLREAEVLLSQGNTIGVTCKKIGVSDYTYYRWRKDSGEKPSKSLVGGHFFCRLFYEFLSLNWMLEELVFRSDKEVD